MTLFTKMFNIFTSKKSEKNPEDICIVEIKEEKEIKQSVFQKLFFWKKTKNYIKDSMA